MDPDWSEYSRTKSPDGAVAISNISERFRRLSSSVPPPPLIVSVPPRVEPCIEIKVVFAFVPGDPIRLSFHAVAKICSVKVDIVPTANCVSTLISLTCSLILAEASRPGSNP